LSLPRDRRPLPPPAYPRSSRPGYNSPCCPATPLRTAASERRPGNRRLGAVLFDIVNSPAGGKPAIAGLHLAARVRARGWMDAGGMPRHDKSAPAALAQPCSAPGQQLGQHLAPLGIRRAQVRRRGQAAVATDEIDLGGVVEGVAAVAARDLLVEGVEG